MRIEMTSTDYPELMSLHDWICHDPAIARQAQIELRSSGRAPDDQGVLDLIDVVVSNATALAALAVSYATWREARRPQSSTTLRSGSREVEVDGDEADPARRIVQALPAGEQEPDPPRAGEQG